jgi:5-carboxymethyl-2-hydroxymuconate isomerase
MPHLTLEYTANIQREIEFEELFCRLHDVLADVGGIKKENCKSRAVQRDRFYLGDGDESGFVHLDVRFLEGRAPDVKQVIGATILSVLLEYYVAGEEEFAPQITVEIRDIERAAYFKYPEGTLERPREADSGDPRHSR